MTKRIKFIISSIFSFSFLFLFFSACTGKNETYTTSGVIWHTTYNISWRGENLPPKSTIEDSIRMVLASVDASVNMFDSTSLVSRLNNMDSIIADVHLAKVYQKSKEIHSFSKGYFDPTVGPLVRAWGFGKGHTASSDTCDISSLLTSVGFDKSFLTTHNKPSEGNSEIIIHKTVKSLEFDFSAIAKGYGADCVGDFFKRSGIDDFLVEIGGEISCHSSEDQRKWRISIDKPIISDSILHESQCVIELAKGGIATSGNYRNRRGDGIRQYGHTISPKTGRPVQTEVLSATVITPFSAMEADAWATAFMAMPFHEAKQIAKERNLAVLLITKDGVWTTPQFDSLIKT